MNNEMMLMQARQDFIDLHKDILAQKEISLDRYDRIARDLHTMDAINFELMLTFVEQTDHIEITRMWNQISTMIDEVKRSGKWNERKSDTIEWKEGQVHIRTGNR